ncbi:MAG: hypothetical protein HYY02_04755 [Chloroflexi bacterium]|nr:hypothetical protein [Chloroflexota bacterium]
MAGPTSMRYQLHEVLMGMLASTEADSFSDDVPRLAAMFEGLATRFPLFAPLAAGVDPAAVSNALAKLEATKCLTRAEQRYLLTEEGRARCVSNKKTLFNQGDREQLEAAATVFNSL